MIGLTLAILLAFTLAAQAPSAQVNVTNLCPADAPIALQTDPVQAGGERQHIINVTNIGTKPITGIILTETDTDSNGTVYPGASTVDFAPSGTSFEPGATMQMEIQPTVSQGRTITAVELNCLAVLHPGTDVWGQAKAPEVAQFIARRHGISAERRRLLGVYQREGLAKLVGELNRPIAK